MNQFQYHLNRIAETVRSIVFPDLFVDGSGFENSRKRFFGYANTRITLSVLQLDIIPRLALLYQIILQQKGILLTCYYHIFDIRYMNHQLPGFAALMLFIEVTVYPPVKILCLTNIDDLPILIKVLVYARTLRNTLQQ